MATQTYKRLGFVSPAAAMLTPLYAAGSGVQAVASSLTICNTNATPVTVRVSQAPSGIADAANQYLYYDLPIDANDTFIATVGWAISMIDVMRCYASATGVNFHLHGVEISA